MIDRRTFMAGSLAAASASRAAAIQGPIAGRVKSVAFLIDQGSAVIDYAGPWEVFQRVRIDDAPTCHLFTVAPAKGLVRTGGGLAISADESLGSAPVPDILVIGAQGEQSAENDQRKLPFIRKVHAEGGWILSVCTGALSLAGTGLLDGKSATTHPIAYDRFESEYPQVRLIRAVRFVDNGRIVTSGGESAGIDGALHLAAKIFGAAAAARSADFMEYQGRWTSA